MLFYNISVDCWDGGSKYENEPVIYHGLKGKTLTTKILFKDVVRDAIKPYAFHTSMYPLILSIENHCSVEYQDKMADHLVDILGEILFTEEVNESRKALPSPEELKFKVLVKAKKHNSQNQLGIKSIYEDFIDDNTFLNNFID